MKSNLLHLLTTGLLLSAAMAGEAGPSSTAAAQNYGTPACPANARGIFQTGVFPARGLVRNFDEQTNIRWKTPLPNFGMNTPVIAAGLVFVLCDPGWKHDAPLLLAVDAATGAVRWQVEVDNLDAPQWTDAQRTEAKQLRADEFRYWRRLREATWEFSQAKDDAAKAAVIAAALKDGLEATKEGVGYGKTHPRGANLGRLSSQGWFDHPAFYHRATFYTGQTMPSAVCDGERVYVHTALSAVACFDLQGKRLWLADARFLRTGFHRAVNLLTASPVLAGGLLVVFAQRGTDEAVAYDARTGAERWRHVPQEPTRNHYAPGSTPVVLDLNGTPAIYLTSGYVLRLADGAVLGRLRHPQSDVAKNAHFGNYGCSVGRGDRLFVNHGQYGSPVPGVFAFRLGVNDTRLASEPAWTAQSTKEKTRSYQHLILDGDRVIAADQGKVLDAATGKVLAEIPDVGVSDPGPILADGLVISLRRFTSTPKLVAKGNTRRSGCEVRFYDTATFQQVGGGFLEADAANEAKRRQCIAVGGTDAWGWGGGNWGGQECNAGLAADGDALFLRSNDNLYCVGKK